MSTGGRCACGLLLASCILGSAPGEETALSAGDRRAIGTLMRRLEAAFLNRDIEALERLLSPRLAHSAKRELLKRLSREFGALKYTEFVAADAELTVLEGPTKVGELLMYRVLVPCHCKYETESQGIGSKVAVNDYAYHFWLDNTGGNWYVQDSSLFGGAGVYNPAMQLGRILFISFLALAAAAFWLFAVWHCYARTRSVLKAAAVLLTTPLGAVVYFIRLMLSPPVG